MNSVPAEHQPAAGARALTLGQPRFAEPRLKALAESQGLEAAWQAAFDIAGEKAPAMVSGPFAVALRRPDGAVYLACDRFAVQTLCWRMIDGRVHFAERADELAALSPRAELDPQAVFDYVYFHVIPAPRTIFEGVHRVEAGHCIRIHGAQISRRRYWTPAFEEPRSASFTNLAAEFRQVLKTAVAGQLDGTKPACFLSGGTDSSTVAGLIGEVTGQPASTFSIGFEADGYDEMAFARIAARRFGTDHHEYYVTPADLVRNIPKVAAQYDQPFGNSSALPAYSCALFARDHGVTHLLAGDGGDELFGGNARYAKQRVFGWYDRVPGSLRRGLLEPTLRSPLGGVWPLRKGRSYVEQASVPLPDRMQMYNLLHRLGIEDVFQAGFLARIDLQAPLRQQQAVWNEVPDADPLNRMLAFDWRYTLSEADLPKVCGTTALAGMSVGFPFLDDAVLAFSQKLPVDYKLKGLKLRWFFKEALRGFLPDEIITKKKQGFGLPFGVWACRDAALNSFARDSLMSLAERNIVRADFIDTLFRTRLPEHPGYFGEMVWILMMLEQWFRTSRVHPTTP